MKYNIWVPPYMPLFEEREPGALYIPKGHIKDDRLNFLDREVYVSICMAAQLEDPETFDAYALISKIKTHPDKDEKILQAYLKKTEKTIETITDKEFQSLPTVPLTAKDFEESLAKLKMLGYIKGADIE